MSMLCAFTHNTEDLQVFPLPEWTQTLTLTPIFCCYLDSMLQWSSSQESGKRKRETGDQESELPLDEVRHGFPAEAPVSLGQNRLGTVWKTII